MHLVPPRKDLFLPIQRQMVVVFGHQNVRQQARCRQTAVLQPFRQGRNHRGLSQLDAVDIFFADRAAAEKAGRFVIQLFADLLSNATPLFRRTLQRFSSMTSSTTGKLSGNFGARSFRERLTGTLGSTIRSVQIRPATVSGALSAS